MSLRVESRRALVVVGVLLVSALAAIPTNVVGAAETKGRHVGPSVSQSKWGSYVIVMAAEPLVATEGRKALNTPRARARARQLTASHNRALQSVAAVGDKIHDYTVALNGFSARLTRQEASKLAARKDVLFVLPDELQQPLTDSSPKFLGLTGPGGAHSVGVTGKGVVVGVIDTGIWPEHPSFAPIVTTPPPTGPLPCEFGNQEHNPDDDPFTCNNKLIGADQIMDTYREVIGIGPDEFDSARDDNGHGSHTASTAAGNPGVQAKVLGRNIARITGIAPRAHVMAYKTCGNQGCFGSDLAEAIDQAVEDGVHVINYSIGGGASLTGPDDIAFLFAADAGLFVAASAGNSGPGPETIGGPASVPWLTAVGANTQSRFFEGTVILGNLARFSGASITGGVDTAPLVDAADAGGDLCQRGTLDPDKVTGAIVLCRRGVVARAEKSLAVFEAGGVGMVMYENSDQGNLFTDTHWVPSVHVDNTPGLAIKAYIATDPSPTARLETGDVSEWPNAPTMTQFSSRGPNPVALDIIKPDITAPGIQILAGNSPFPDPDSTPPGELFQAIAGTSMSSPHVAGLFALLKQVHPDWSAASAKSALMTTANPDVRDNDRVSQATPFGMGSGHANPGRPRSRGSSFQPGLVYDAGFNDYLGFLCDEAPEVFENPEETCQALEDAGFPTQAHNLNYPSIGMAELAGSETIKRKVTSVASGRRTYSVTVDAPVGYSVTVSPPSFSINPGETVNFTVTIENQTAPIGEWRFGSIRWTDMSGLSSSVRSPIAVRAALFSAPEEISGEGESGSESFDVKFGYTGEYSAGAHGLIPATLTVDNVPQDPDQNFDPNDGFSDAHTFNLSGVLHFRIAIPPEATEEGADLDVYVFDPNGDLVASSTRGGTDEQVDITSPQDGAWTVYVHGWATPGGDSDYTMYTWEIPEATGGSLVIDSAPTEAVIGETGTIEISWSGATLGEWHLGAVSHNRGSDLLDVTLVNVDNR